MMEQNPYTEDQEKASEYLRLAIALLAKHQIPVSPLNYRLGYDAVSGRNAEFDRALAKEGSASEIPLSDRLLVLHQSLYTLNNE